MKRSSGSYGTCDTQGSGESDVDLLVIQDGLVRVVVEVEESAIKPTIVCGKFLTSALATHFRHKSLPGGEAPLRDVLFIQVMKSGHLAANSKKRKQHQTIETAIQNCVRVAGSQIIR